MSTECGALFVQRLMSAYLGNILMSELDDLMADLKAAEANVKAAEAEALRASDKYVAARSEANRLWRLIKEKNHE